MSTKLPYVAVLGNGGQSDTFRVASTTAISVARECLSALASWSLVGEFDSEPGFGTLLDVIDGDSGG